MKSFKINLSALTDRLRRVVLGAVIQKADSLGYDMGYMNEYGYEYGYPYLYIQDAIRVYAGNVIGAYELCPYTEVSAEEFLGFSRGDVEDDKSRFKPFDKVVARLASDYGWYAGYFSHEGNRSDNGEHYYNVSGLFCLECLPYEGNEYLVGKIREPK